MSAKEKIAQELQQLLSSRAVLDERITEARAVLRGIQVAEQEAAVAEESAQDGGE